MLPHRAPRAASIGRVNEHIARSLLLRESVMQFISIKQVCELIGLSRTQVTEKDANGKPRAGMEEFPEPLYIGYRRLYNLDEVQEWQRKRLEERGSTPKRERKSK